MTMTAVWKDVLGIEEVGLRDNFFDLGGHSLLATRLAVRLRQAFNIDLTVRTVLEAPTVAELAERIVASMISAATPEALAEALASIEREPG